MRENNKSTWTSSTGIYISGLPKIISHYPVLIWGYNPCENNSICRLWLGPNNRYITHTKRGYPQFNNPPSSALIHEDISFDLDELIQFNLSADIILDLIQWADIDPSILPLRYEPSSPNRLKIKGTAEWTNIDWKNLTSIFTKDISKKLIEKYYECHTHLQQILIDRGMRLWSNQPDKSFSFHPETGEIEICNGDQLLHLQSSMKTQQRADSSNWDGLINWDGLSLNFVDFKEANLSKGSMIGTVLMGANLRKANLSESNLTNANLGSLYDESTFLIEANLRNSTMKNINLSESILDKADLTKSDLDSAILRGASMNKANLTQCNLHNADLSPGLFDVTLLTNVSCIQSNLENANLERVDLQGSNLDGSNIKNALLKRATLDTQMNNVDLRGANLESVQGYLICKNSNLEGVNLKGASLCCSEFDNSNLKHTILDGIDLSSSYLLGTILDEAQLIGANLSDADLRGASFKNANLSQVNIKNAQYNDATSWPVGFDPKSHGACYTSES